MINLLDFLETIACFEENKEVTAEELFEVIGKSTLFFYFQIFKKSIIPERKTAIGASDGYYAHFQDFIMKIDKKLEFLRSHPPL